MWIKLTLAVLAVLIAGLGSWYLMATGHTLMVDCLLYAAVLYGFFVKDIVS